MELHIFDVDVQTFLSKPRNDHLDQNAEANSAARAKRMPMANICPSIGPAWCS